MNPDNKATIEYQFNDMKVNGVDYERYVNILTMCRIGYNEEPSCKWEYKAYSDKVKEAALRECQEDKQHERLWRTLYCDTLKAEAFHFFDSFLRFMELKRPFDKKFYEPREGTLRTVVDDLQAFEDGNGRIFYGLSLPSRVGKSTMMLFLISWKILRNPYSHNAIATHSGVVAEHFYNELLDFFESSEYTFYELYSYYHPGSKYIEFKSSEKLTISFAQRGDFPAITCRGIDGSWTGVVDISSDGYLCVDDLVRDRTHSLSPKRMNDTFSEYLNKMVERKNDGSKEIMIGTLWNVLDPLMRLEEMYKDDSRYFFRKIPALNDDDESNFNYPVKGFSTEYYRDMRDKMIRAGDEAFWMAKFQQRPYVREGLLFPLNELGTFNGVLMQDKKYKYIVVCDVAFGGGDSVSMPIGLQDTETQKIYVIDWFFSSAGVKQTIPGVVDMLMKYDIRNITFERNSGGLLFAKQVQEELDRRKYVCNCESKRAPNGIDKISKIKACEPKIKEFVMFLDGNTDAEADDSVFVFKKTAMYQRALDELTTFVTIGKNLHDDAADSIAQMVMATFDTIHRTAVIIDSPF